MTTITKTKDFFKKDVARWNIVAMFLISIVVLISSIWQTTLNNAEPLWIWLSFVSAIFGMLNVTTYSIMDLSDEKKRNKYRIFILFNSIAVLSLATINLHYQLYTLMIENALFFFSGCVQYYHWFIKYDPNEESEFSLEKINKDDNKYFIYGFILIFVFLFMTICVGGWTYDQEYNNLIIDHKKYFYTRSMIDSFLGVGGILGAYMVARRKIISCWIYWINDTFLILLWVILLIISTNQNTELLKKDAHLNAALCINMIGLFSFYFFSNIMMYKKYKPLLK